ncbi:MAG: hypothetical protein J6T51_01585 [Kiritimatiellae bacterium]|nr:hypothetical protein [Kiritimatiellia bacterium]
MLAANVVLGGESINGAWAKYEGNPVLGDPVKLGTCFDVNVVKGRDAKFDMYFSWRPKKSIAVCSSDDGIHWSKPEIVLRPDSACGWEQIVNRASVVRKDGKWHMWYTGQVLACKGRKGTSKIGYAISDDGRVFRKVQKEPVMVAGAPFEKDNVMNPHVMWDGRRGAWRMWYSAGEQYEPNVNCYAESEDGVKWQKSPLNPVLAKGAREWEQNRVGGCEVHPLPDGTFVMFYIGYKDINTASIGAAVSEDGISGWRRLKANPLVTPTPGTFDASACYKPSVFRDEKNGRWMLWYNGRNGGKGEYIGLVLKEGLGLGDLEP